MKIVRGGSPWSLSRCSVHTVKARQLSRQASQPTGPNAISVKMADACGASFFCSTKIAAEYLTPPSGRHGTQWQWYPRHRPCVADQSHDRDRRVKKNFPCCNTPTSCWHPRAYASAAPSHSTPPKWMKCGVSSAPKRRHGGSGMRSTITQGESWPMSSAPGRMQCF